MTELYMITEYSPFKMGFVFLTDGGQAVIVDGGRPADMPPLLELVGDRKIAAWILTHPHLDHISGFNDLIAGGFDTDKIEKADIELVKVDGKWLIKKFEAKN